MARYLRSIFLPFKAQTLSKLEIETADVLSCVISTPILTRSMKNKKRRRADQVRPLHNSSRLRDQDREVRLNSLDRVTKSASIFGLITWKFVLSACAVHRPVSERVSAASE